MGPPAGLFGEIARWRDKAQRKGICTFTSDIIPHWLNHQIAGAMEAVGIDAAFSFLKADIDTRETEERQLQRQIQPVLDEFEPVVIDAIEAGEAQSIDYQPFAAALSTVFVPFLTGIFTREALRTSAEIGIGFDPAVVNTAAIEWAQTHSFDLISGLTDHTRALVQKTVASFFETPGMTQGDLEKLLEPAFGKVRARMISITEVTRATSGGTTASQRMLEGIDVPLTRIWNTANDERVCPICGPLNGMPEEFWRNEFPEGPPAHPNCRGSLSLSGASTKFHLKDAVERGVERVQMFEEGDDQAATEVAKDELKKQRELLRNV